MLYVRTPGHIVSHENIVCALFVLFLVVLFRYYGEEKLEIICPVR